MSALVYRSGTWCSLSSACTWKRVSSPSSLADLRLRQRTGTVALDRDGFKGTTRHIIPLLLKGGGYVFWQLNGDPHDVQFYR